ncbi:MAG: extracellular solute-binding protein [Anaerolineae bacterium]|nr:MAG: extracellular solute-binding protein [Anaerolineae bacterium]
MRKLIILGLLVVLVVGLSAVSAQDMSGVDPSGQTVVYWHQYNSDPQLATMNALIEEFNSTNEWGITVEGTAQGNYNDIRDLMNAAIISGELPNLVAGFQNDALSYYRDGAATDITPYVNDSTYGIGDLNLNQGILAVNVFADQDGAMLAWPNQISANVLAVNLTMLGELGFDAPPTTFEEFKAIACAAAEAEETEGYPIKADSSNFESMVASHGGSIFVDGQYNFTSPEVIATFEFYKDLYDSGCAYLPDSQFGNTDDFAIGKNPMALGSTAGLPFIQGGMDAAGYVADWVVTTTPWTEGNRTLQIYVPSIIMVPSTPEQELASWLFLKFLSGVDQQVAWTTATSYFPMNLDATAGLADFVAENPRFGEAFALLNDPEVTLYFAPQQLSYGAIRGLVSEALADVTSNGRDVMEVAEELEAEANAAHADAQ